MAAYGEFIDTLISGSSFLGNDIYVAGALGADTGIVQADNSAPRNAIDLYYLPLALRSDTFVAHGAPQAGKRTRPSEVQPKHVAKQEKARRDHRENQSGFLSAMKERIWTVDVFVAVGAPKLNKEQQGAGP